MESLGIVHCMDSMFWKNKRVFLTGHTGFKGSWLSLWLQSMGAIVRGYSLPVTNMPNLFSIARVAEGMESYEGDIRNFDKLKQSLVDFEPEVVFHLAAQSLVRTSYESPVETYDVNVMGLVHLLEAIRSLDALKAVVIVTSDKCYDNKERQSGYREDEALGGHDPYSSSKGCAELLTSSYRYSFFNSKEYKNHGCAIATGRAGNVIGGGDWADDRLVPDLLRALEQGQRVRIRNPNSIRPWQHVLEPLGGYLQLAECLFLKGNEFASAWNFGPDKSDERPVQWIVETMLDMWGDNRGWSHDVENHPHEANNLNLDCSKAKLELAWSPKQNIKDALSSTIDWHKAWLTGDDMRKITMLDIDRYIKKIV